MARAPTTPYQQPPLLTTTATTLLRTIHHVALSSKSYRIFGLADEAWLIARDDLKRLRRVVNSAAGGDDYGSNNNAGDDSHNNGDDGGGNNDGVDSNSKEVENDEEMMEICDSICTALQEDAGGYGTCGFHLEKVKNVQLSIIEQHTAMVTCTLHPNDPSPSTTTDSSSSVAADGYVELSPHKLIQAHYNAKKHAMLLGNDEVYSKLYDDRNANEGCGGSEGCGEEGRFKLRIVVSKANEGVPCQRFHEGLFDLSNELATTANSNNSSSSSDGERREGITEEMVESNDTLRTLKQLVLDARIVNEEQQHDTTNNNNNNMSSSDSGKNNSSNSSSGAEQTPILGYYVTIMLCEPHIQNEDIVIPPPPYLDKCDGNFKAVPYSDDDTVYTIGGSKGKDDNNKEEEEEGGGVFSSGNINTSLQFITPGPWEIANLEAFELIALDVKKALVRVEFPMFPEGCREKTFREVYQLNARLKSGSLATVCRGTHRSTGKKVAIKCVLRQDLPPNDDAAIYDEVLILSTLRHRYICPLIDFFEEVECYFLVMELMSGGDLFDRIGKRKTYTENDARDLCRKMLESVRYCHENSVAHCDMKPKNLLLSDDDDDVEIKLSDFGFAARVYEPRSISKQCGTPFFVAPEVLMRSPYDQQSDMWSVGVIMYLLLGGDLPFMGRTQKELFRSIVLGKYDFPEESWSHVSDEARDLVKKLLVTDPSERLTSRDAMQSSWMRQRGNLLAQNNLLYASRRLKTFNARMKLRSSMIAVTLITSARLSISKKFASDRSRSSGGSQRSVESASKKLPSFLDIPAENDDAEQK